jgi:hypothetical protein
MLKSTLAEDRFPLAPRLAPLKSLLAKLEPLKTETGTGCGHWRAAGPRALG